MKTAYKILFAIILSFTQVIAPSITGRAGGGSALAQNIGEAFYIYRNDGQFNAFFREEIDSMAYSNYDADSVLYDNAVSQVIYTQDSTYVIPLAAIDSVSFVQPETVYSEGTLPITGTLFNYLIAADSMSLTFDPSLPVELTPRIGDKLVATDMSEKLPHGFVGQVRQVDIKLGGIEVMCDSIALSDAVSKFYDVIEIGVSDDGEVKPMSPRKAHAYVFYDNELPHGPIHVPPIDLSAWFGNWDNNNSFKNSFDITFTPQIRLKLTRVVDGIRTHYNLLAVTDADVNMDMKVAVASTTDYTKPVSEMKKWEKKLSFLGKNDFPIVTGISFYFEPGVKATFAGKIAAGFAFDYYIHQVSDITFYDLSLHLPPMVAAMVNRSEGSISITTTDMRWNYLAAKAELKLCAYLRTGLSAIGHKIGWIGGEFDGGLKLGAELYFDIDRLAQDEKDTKLYDELKNIVQVTVNPYVGAHFMVSAVDDKYYFRMGNDLDNILGTWYQGHPLPYFSNTKATRTSATTAKISADITNDCPIPYTVGFVAYDEDGNRASEPAYNEEKYWTRHAFPSYTCELEGLEQGRKYKVYPVIRWFDKYDMLCSPSAELKPQCPVTLSDFKVTKSQYNKGAFTNDNIAYDYRFDVSVTATLEADDLSKISDWGYVYRDPNGQNKEISLKGHGTSYTDVNYAYFRNGTPPFTCTLYGYVKYVGSDEPVYGEPHNYPLEYGETTCPDGNHPHWIDMGLPSGTQWRCCNEGASSPEAYGGYYTFGQVSSAPTLEQIRELLNYCTSEWTSVNGVYGRKFTGPNGGIIFLPAAGGVWDGELYGVSYGYYWSSTPDDSVSAYELYFSSGYAYCGSFNYGRYYGQSVRPVR